MLGAAALLLALAAGVWLVLRDDDDALDPGPVSTPVRDRLGWPQPAGKAFGFGMPVVFNRGKDVAVLDRIRIVDPPRGLDVLDTGIGGPKRRVTNATSLRWPAPRDFRDLHPVRGYRLRPGAPGGAQLVFALRANRPGRYAFKAITLDYRIGDTRYRARISVGLAVCAHRPERPPKRPGGCEPPRDL